MLLLRLLFAFAEDLSGSFAPDDLSLAGACLLYEPLEFLRLPELVAALSLPDDADLLEPAETVPVLLSDDGVLRELDALLPSPAVVRRELTLVAARFG